MSALKSAWRRMNEDLAVVVERDPAVHDKREALLSSYLPALWLHPLAHRLYRAGHRCTARIVSLVGRALSGGVEIHPGARLGRRFFVDHGAAVVIGEDAVIGDDVTLYHQVTIGAVGWWRDRGRPAGERRHPTLGDRVVVGANASVLGPVHVGADCLVGAHALVVTDVPAASRVLSPPSRIRPAPAPPSHPAAPLNGTAPSDPAPAAAPVPAPAAGQATRTTHQNGSPRR
ncbi:serine O-acetyltransferase EpsC [Streptomyces tremellae]|uniref:serine O-acetyltransferase n=1 Tax=Streptomyces tremellae TaxID=1124239 RepID=A0ABP7FVT4_9ACTN